MKAVCTKRKRSELSLERCRQYLQETSYELTVGAVYTVYAQCVSHTCLLYLIDPRTRDLLSWPFWYPAECFVISESSMGTGSAPSEPVHIEGDVWHHVQGEARSC